MDLKKLANAGSLREAEVGVRKYGVSKGFSPDSEEMVVGGACFGCSASQEGGGREGWAAMTLWIAMQEGDLYALCPLLPTKWRASSDLLGGLSTSVCAKARALSRDGGSGDVISERERRKTEQQCRWLGLVDAQEPLLETNEVGLVEEVYTRPEKPGAVPKLQGPFAVSPELELFGEVTDVFVVAPKVDEEELYGGEEEDEYDDLGSSEEEGLSVGIICLATSTARVHICLDLNGVEAEWLPNKRSRAFTPDDDGEEGNELLLFETVDLSGGEIGGYPSFTPSPTGPYELLLTLPGSGVYALDFRPWTTWLEEELASPTDAGIKTRMDVMLASNGTTVQQLIRLPSQGNVETAIAVLDSRLGHLVLTTAGEQSGSRIYSAILSTSTNNPNDPSYAPDNAAALPAPEPRAPYQPSPIFYRPSALSQLGKTAQDKYSLRPGGLEAKVRFSPATLQLLTEAHRVLSRETHELGLAAAECFRACERLRSEVGEQVRKVREIEGRVEGVIGAVGEEEEGGGGEEEDGEDEQEQDVGGGKRAEIEARVQRCADKRAELESRVERVRRKMAGLSKGGEMSAKEKAFALEVEKLDAGLIPPSALLPAAPTSPQALLHMPDSPSASASLSASTARTEAQDANSLAARLEALEQLRPALLKQLSEATEREGKREGGSGWSASEFRKQKLRQVWGLLERETALVEGVEERVGRLMGT